MKKKLATNWFSNSLADNFTKKKKTTDFFLLLHEKADCKLLSLWSCTNHWQVFFKIGALKNFSNFTGKPLSWSFFSIKWHASGCAKFLRTPFFTEHLRWLLSIKILTFYVNANGIGWFGSLSISSCTTISTLLFFGDVIQYKRRWWSCKNNDL